MNHVKLAHSDAVQNKLFAPPRPAVLANVDLQCKVGERAGLRWVTVSLTIHGKELVDIAHEAEAVAAATEAAKLQRSAQMRLEASTRRNSREKAVIAGQDLGEQRRGSAHRASYTAVQKQKILYEYDKIRDDPSVTSKIAEWKDRGYEARIPGGSRGSPWTSIRPWSEPVERARIARAASKEYAKAHASTLLSKRIDNESRKKGKYFLMERELFSVFKESRAHGRKVSARWLSAVGKLLMKKHYPGQACATQFCGSASWRRRFSNRFQIGVRRKTNCKCTTWDETKLVLQRYFETLRRRLQLPMPKPYETHEQASAAKPIDCALLRPTDEQIDIALYSNWEVLERLAVTPEAMCFGFTLDVIRRAKAVARIPVDPLALPELATDLDEEDEEESEPPDVNPARNDEGERELDSEDEDDDGEPPLHPFELPEGRAIVAVPTPQELERNSPEWKALAGREILFNWPVVGWCVGKLVPNTDGRRRVSHKGAKVCPNFWAYYEIDQQELPHFLSPTEYGQEGGPGAWVLLE
jgi:hypothetical protein